MDESSDETICYSKHEVVWIPAISEICVSIWSQIPFALGSNIHPDLHCTECSFVLLVEHASATFNLET